jgi:protoheme IX farnesyltransferase
MSRVSEYYRLAKPGIVYGNLLTTIAAFFFARGYELPGALGIFVATAFGISLVIASACVFNNYLDRDMDRMMKRTKNRALVTGAISVRSALAYGMVLGLAGLALLILYVNVLTAAIALFGFISYVAVYSSMKRSSPLAALVGSIPGAVPIVVGYTAVTGHLDLIAGILFLILAAWQMPHFYAIALYRLEEYAAAKVPTFAVVKGVRATKIHLFAYLVLFFLASLSLGFGGHVHFVYLAVMFVASSLWLYKAAQGFTTKEDARWAKSVFRFSLIVLLVFCAAISLAPFVP